MLMGAGEGVGGQDVLSGTYFSGKERGKKNGIIFDEKGNNFPPFSGAAIKEGHFFG